MKNKKELKKECCGCTPGKEFVFCGCVCHKEDQLMDALRLAERELSGFVTVRESEALRVLREVLGM